VSCSSSKMHSSRSSWPTSWAFDVVWEVEHHFLEEYSHSSAPEVFLAACSQRTRNIRLGHGIIQTAPAYNHPARTAERVCDARPRVGWTRRVRFWRSSSEAELAGFTIVRSTSATCGSKVSRSPFVV